MRRSVKVSLMLVGVGVVSFALALVLRSEALAMVGALTIMPGLLALSIIALFSYPMGKADRSETFLAWIWRETDPERTGRRRR